MSLFLKNNFKILYLIVNYNKNIAGVYSLMTDVIDLYFCSTQQSLNKSFASFNSRQSRRQIKTKQINQVLENMISKIDQNYIKTIDSYVFRLQRSENRLQNCFYNNGIKQVGAFRVKKHQYQLRIQFHAQSGQKIIVQSPYHRVLLSNFVLQINAQLENYKIQYNPVSGEASFVFNVQSQNREVGALIEFLEYSLSVYFEECSAYFYLLNLLQISRENENIYLKPIKQRIDPLKLWISERLNQNRQCLGQMDFYENYVAQTGYQNMSYKTKIQKKVQNQRHLEQIQRYLYPQHKLVGRNIQISQNKMYKIYKKFQNYYKQEEILSLHLLNKINHQNYLSITAVETLSLISFLSKRGILIEKQGLIPNDHQIALLRQNQQFDAPETIKNFYFNREKQVQYEKIRQERELQIKNLDNQIINLVDKDSGKNYAVKAIFLATKQAAIRQYKICQKFTNYDSYKFFNQYIILSNYQFLKDGYAFVNAFPKRISLAEFIESNLRTLSVSAKINICINILQIVLIVHKKNKISAYFPSMSPANIEINQNLYLNIKILAQTTRYPLLQMINTISYVFFGKPLNYIKRNDGLSEIVKGDESEDKFWGPSYCILLLKYYLYQLHEETLKIQNILQVGPHKRIPQQQLDEIEMHSKKRILTACQQLLNIMYSFGGIFYRGFEEEYSLSRDEMEEEC